MLGRQTRTVAGPNGAGVVLRHSAVTSVLIGASGPQQILDNLAAVKNLDFTDAELETLK